MAQLNKLPDNLTAGFVTKTDLKYLVSSIFTGTTVPELESIGLQTHPSGKSNRDFHNSQIMEQVNKVCTTQYDKLDYTISRILLSKFNKINIDVHVQKSKDTIQFYLAGPDLSEYYMFLPKISHYPHTGPSHSKWYGLECRTKIIAIALGLKMMELLLFGTRISCTYTISNSGILGAEVPFTIPEKYKENSLCVSQAQIYNKTNPSKVSPGIFLFGKNGIGAEQTCELLGELRKRFVHIETQVYPSVITNWDLSDFVKSQYKFALSSWNRHARICIKNCKKVDVLIIDPWMNGLPRIVSSQLVPANSSTRIGFFSRSIKDQKSEGSCVFCALARLISVVDSYVDTDKFSDLIEKSIESNLTKPTEDFYAYLIKTVYGTLIK